MRARGDGAAVRSDVAGSCLDIPMCSRTQNLCQLHRTAEAVPAMLLLPYPAFHVPAAASGRGSETHGVHGSPGPQKSCEVVGKGCGSKEVKEMVISLPIFVTQALLAPELEFHKRHCPSGYVLGCLKPLKNGVCEGLSSTYSQASV